MAFHRFVAPSYFGGLPVGYDYLNNATSGTPAAVAGVRADGGPDNGTYFVGFGENAVSPAFNRGLAALGQNTDQLDDFIRRDIAIVKNTALTTAVSPVSTIVLTGPGIFLGVPGTVSSPAAFADIFSLVDDAENEIIDLATGTKSRVVSMIGGAIGGSFSSASVTVTINPAIPAGVQYKIYYGQRSNLATMPIDAFTKVTLRGAEELSAGFLDFRAQTSRRDGSQNVLALLAATIETPDGTRLPRSSTQTFDVDPFGGLGGPYGATWRRNRDATAVVMAELVDQPVSDVFGLARWFSVGRTGVNGVGSNGGTLALFDVNTSGATAPAKYVPFSENTNGAQTLRIAEIAQSTSILRSLNGRAYVSVGDGAVTFGDFNGPTAIVDAIAAFGVSGTLHIRVKAGAFGIAGATGPTIPGGLFVTIEGEGADSSVITSTVADGQTFNITGGTLTLRSLRLSAGTGTATVHGIFTGMSGYLRAYHCAIERHKLDFVNSNGQALAADGTSPTSYWKSILIAEDSSLDMTGANAAVGTRPLIHVHVSDGLEHHNFTIRNSNLRCIDNNTPFKIEMPNTATLQSRVRHVLFDNCRIFLGGATQAGQYLDANPGVLWCEPNNTVGLLGVDNLVWRNCNVWSNFNLTGTCSTLMHLHPGNLRYNTSSETGKSNIGKVTVDGGEWYVPDVNTLITPWLLHSRTTTVRNVTIRQTSMLTGKVPRDALLYLSNAPNSGVPLTTVYWGAICFYANLRAEPVVPFEPMRSLEITNVRIRNVQQAQSTDVGGCSDLYIAAPTTSAKTLISDVRISGAVTNTPSGGKIPTYRAQVFLAGIGGECQDLVWDGTEAVVDGTPWCDVAGSFLNLLSSSSISGQGTFRRCGVIGVGTSSGRGIYTAPYGATQLDHCFAQNCSVGLYIYGSGAGGSLTATGGSFCFNGAGIQASGDASFAPTFTFNGVNASNNTASNGLFVSLPYNSWYRGTGTPSALLNVVNSVFINNGGAGSNQVRVEKVGTSGGTDFCSGIFIGNTLQGPGSGDPGIFKLGAISATEAVRIRGLTDSTGSISAGSALTLNFANMGANFTF